MKQPASRRRYRWDDPMPASLVIGQVRPTLGRRLRKTFSLPKIAAALVGVVSVVTIGGLVFIVASSLPNRSDAIAEGVAKEAAQPLTAAVEAPEVQQGVPAEPAQVVAVPASSQAADTVAVSMPETTATVPTRRIAAVAKAQDASEVAAFAEDEARKPAAGAAAAVAAIASGDAAPKIERNAETGRQVAVFVPAKPAAAKADQRTDESKAEQDDASAGGQTVVTRSGVNLRSAPKGGVIGTIPGGVKVSLVGPCDHWCKVRYEGKTGFVYKSFIRR